MIKAKEKPLLGGAGLRKLTDKAYGPQPIWQAWQREAARLLQEFRRTGNPKHLVALTVHIQGMRVRLESECT